MTFKLTILQCLLTIFFLLTPVHSCVGRSALQTGQKVVSSDLIVKSDGKLALISIDLKQLKALEEKGEVLPISVRVEKGRIISRYRTKGTKAYFLIYERDGEKFWHGVYALFKEKNNFGVQPPSGGSIHFPGLNYKQALRHQLVLVGLKKSEAKSILERHEKEWFKEGLHIFYLLEAANAKLTLGKKIPDGAKAVLIKIEIPNHTR